MHRVHVDKSTATRLLRRGALVAGLIAAIGLVVTAEADTGSAYFNVGRKLVEHGDAHLGIQYVATALALEPSNFVTQTYFVTLLDQDRFRDDLGVLSSVRPILPHYPPVLERAAKLLDEKQQRGEEADALYEEWRTLRPDSAEAQARAGEHYRFAGKDKEALDAFSDYLGVVQESDYAVRRIAESAAKIAIAQTAAVAIHLAVNQ
jgi:tetratricopeptide (TPR) repeat protein